jgi:hypothetical protein
MSPKEIRYRRLLALYPSEFRREYADEMLGVLMADPRPARSHAVDLVAGAFAARFRETLGDVAWRRAARAVQLFGAILLCSLSVRRLVTGGAMAVFDPAHAVPPIPVVDLIRGAAWAAAVAAAFAGWRWLGVVAALVGLGGEIVAPIPQYAETPATFLHAYWIIVSAAVVFAASAVPARGSRPRGLPIVAAAGVLLVGNGLTPWSLGGPYVSGWRLPGPDGPHLFRLVPLLGAGLLLVWAVTRLEPSVRRRVVACAVPVLGAFPLVSWGFGGFEEFNMRHPENLRLLGPAQWAGLVLIPVLAFGVAAWLNMRLEQTRAVSGSEAPEM